MRCEKRSPARDAVIDHLQVRRQHGDADARDGIGRDAFGQEFLKRLRCRHGLARRAPGLERDLAERRFAPSIPQQRRVRDDPVDVFQEFAVGELQIGGEAGPRGKRRLQAAAGGLADREPARRGRRRVMAGAGRRHDQRGGKRMRRLRLVEPQQPGSDGGHAERGGEIARPDAAIKHARPVDRRAEPDHRLISRDDGRRDIGLVGLRQRRRNGQRRRNDDGPRCDHRAEMNVIDLAQPRERAVDRNLFEQRRIRPAEGEKRPALGGRRRRHPGTDRVGRVQPRSRARALIRRMARNEGAKLLQCAHGRCPMAPPPSTARTITHRLQLLSQTSSGIEFWRCYRGAGLAGRTELESIGAGFGPRPYRQSRSGSMAADFRAMIPLASRLDIEIAARMN